MSKVVSISDYLARRRRDDEPTVVQRLRGRAKHLAKGSPEERRDLAVKRIEAHDDDGPETA